MDNNAIETVNFCFTGRVIARLGSLADESAQGVEKALSQSIPLLLNGLANRVGHGLTPEGLLALVSEADTTDVLKLLDDPNLSATSRHDQGTNLLLDLLGNGYRDAVNEIALEANIRATASGTLLQVAATAVLGVLGRFAVENAFSPTDFVYWLHAKKEAIAVAMLPRLSAGALAGAVPAAPPRQPLPPSPLPLRATGPGVAPAAAMPPLARPLPPTLPSPMPTAKAGRKRLRWQEALLLLVALGLGYFFVHSGTPAPVAEAPRPTRAATVSDSTDTAMAAALATAVAAASAVPEELPELAPMAAPPAPVAAVAAPATMAFIPAARPRPAPAPGAVAPKAAAGAPVPPAEGRGAIAALVPVLAPVAAARPAAETRPVNERRTAAPARANFPAGRFDPNRDAFVYDTGRPTELALGSGNVQRVGSNSTENHLYKFLASPAARVDSVNRTRDWIAFDQVFFEPGRAALKPESLPQLANVARILKAFPEARVKIGGFTDSTGVVESNYQLSSARARAVMTVLANSGVSLYRLNAQGFGEKFFLTPNVSPAARALNRRVSIRVLRK